MIDVKNHKLSPTVDKEIRGLIMSLFEKLVVGLTICRMTHHKDMCELIWQENINEEKPKMHIVPR